MPAFPHVMRLARIGAPRAAILAALLAANPSARAQAQFADLDRLTVPHDYPVGVKGFAFGDIDGDGDLDVVVATDSYPEPDRLWRNDGVGTYTDVTSTQFPNTAYYSKAVVVGDVDGDGDLDLVFGGAAQDALFVNDGSGTFAAAAATRLPGHATSTTTALALGDVDADGDLDLVVMSVSSQNRLYRNDGTGTFTDVTATALPVDTDKSLSVALGDVDGDGDLDVVVGNLQEQNRLYLNDGAGTFTDGTMRLPTDSDETAAVALADVDRDGDLDLLCGNGWQTAMASRLYLNDGSGTFVDESNTHLPLQLARTASVAFGDVDGDGDLDVVLGRTQALAPHNGLWLNDGTGTFVDATGVLPVDESSDVAFGDVDVDGDLDLLLNTDPSRALLFNDGSGAFTVPVARLPRISEQTEAAVLGDVDGDGDLDLLTGSGYDRLYRNDGFGRFAVMSLLPTPGLTYALALGDVDGDGDLDLAAGNAGQNELLLNDGTGTFSVAPFPADRDPTRAVAFGDVDGDGDLDLVLANGQDFGITSPRNRLYLNDGSGAFTDVSAAQMPFDTDRSYGVTLGDVDGDGDLDLVFANGGAASFAPLQNRLYRNDGSGTFTDVTAGHMPVDQGESRAAALVDVDGDGDRDLVFANRGSFLQTAQNTLYLNDGSGTFTDVTPTRLPVDFSIASAVAAFDADLDGDVDLVFGNVAGTEQLWLNDGSGTFTDATARLPFSRDGTEAVASGDVDGDGDIDLVFVNDGVGDENWLWLNLQRQTDVPFPLRLGRAYPLLVYSRYGVPSIADVALPLLAFGTASIPVPPFGTFGLDPTRMVALPPFLIPRPAGVGSLTLTAPASPSLLGLAVYTQALVQPYFASPRLTNVTGDVLTR